MKLLLLNGAGIHVMGSDGVVALKAAEGYPEILALLRGAICDYELFVGISAP